MSARNIQENPAIANRIYGYQPTLTEQFAVFCDSFEQPTEAFLNYQAARQMRRHWDSQTDLINDEIGSAVELEAAIYEIRRRLSTPAHRSDVEAIALRWARVRDLVTQYGIKSFDEEVI